MAGSDLDELWCWAEDELESLWTQEKLIRASLPERNRSVLYGRLSVVYLRYVVVSRQLDVCYHNMIHVQKRRDVLCLIRAVCGRIIELKNELAALDFNETPFLGTALNQLNLSPEQVDPPLTVLNQGVPSNNDHKQLVSNILTKLERAPKAETSALSWDEAVGLIQIHERARQGRLRFLLMKQIRQQKTQQGRGLQKSRTTMTPTQAAHVIQSHWRRLVATNYVDQLRRREMIFLGMISDAGGVSDAVVKNQKLAEMRMGRRKQLEEEYQHKYQLVRNDLRKSDLVANKKEQLLDSLRCWYLEQRHSNGKFPDIPPQDEGGSRTLQLQHCSSPTGLAAEAVLPEAEAQSLSLFSAKKLDDAKSSGTVSKKRSGAMNKNDDDKSKGVDMAASLWLANIVHENRRYDNTWRNHDGTGVGWDEELLKEEAIQELDEEIQLEVDQVARVELARLKSAFDRDRGKKNKKGRKAVRKSSKKMKRGRKEKDLTPDRSVESLVEELVGSGVIRSFNWTSMDRFIGAVATVDPFKRKSKRDSFPSNGDIRIAFIEHCLLSLGSEEIRQRTPLTRSVLLAGPHGVGKSMLVSAACSHVGATLFDMSHSSLLGRYPGKAGMLMLIHLITKMSKILQPSVILIEDVERVFMKKSGRSAQRWDMRRMRKELPKIIRSIAVEDRVLVIGTTTIPWQCEQRSLSQCFQRMLVVPPPDYGTRYLMWEKFIGDKTPSSLPPMSELSNLARISDSYTPGSIARSVSEILSERRQRLLLRQPLKADEFVSALARCEPVYKEEEENLRQWYAKTPLRRKRNRNPDADDDEFLSNAASSNEKKKKKKKKKKKSKKKAKR